MSPLPVPPGDEGRRGREARRAGRSQAVTVNGSPGLHRTGRPGASRRPPRPRSTGRPVTSLRPAPCACQTLAGPPAASVYPGPCALPRRPLGAAGRLGPHLARPSPPRSQQEGGWQSLRPAPPSPPTPAPLPASPRTPPAAVARGNVLLARGLGRRQRIQGRPGRGPPWGPHCPGWADAPAARSPRSVSPGSQGPMPPLSCPSPPGGTPTLVPEGPWSLVSPRVGSGGRSGGSRVPGGVPPAASTEHPCVLCASLSRGCSVWTLGPPPAVATRLLHPCRPQTGPVCTSMSPSLQRT